MTTTKALPKYTEIRARLQAAQDRAPIQPCIKGKANCCDRSVGLSRADASYLQRAIDQGQIPAPVVERARKNALDRKNDRCPFLDENKACTIYSARPLICMAWGIGGRPRPESTPALIARKQIQERTGTEQTVTADEIVMYVCASCSEEIKGSNPSYLLSSIEAITTAWLYLHADDESGSNLTNFARRQLKPRPKRK